MNMQKAYIWLPVRQMDNFSTQFLGVLSLGILAKLHPITLICIWVLIFSCRFLQYFENTFFRTLVHDGFFKFNWDSIVTTRHSFKDCILAYKLREKFFKQSVVILLISDCSVRHMFCTIFAPLSVAKTRLK